MIQHRVAKVLTFNDADFRSFTEIELLNPFDVLGRPKSQHLSPLQRSMSHSSIIRCD